MGHKPYYRLQSKAYGIWADVSDQCVFDIYLHTIPEISDQRDLDTYVYAIKLSSFFHSNVQP